MKRGERVGSWELLQPLGKGGQGEVFLARNMKAVDDFDMQLAPVLVKNLESALSHRVSESPPAVLRIIEATRSIAEQEGRPSIGALKRLLPFDSAVNASTAADRMKLELEALRAVSHPALVRLLDVRVDQSWFVMEHLGQYTLGSKQTFFKGDVRRALEALRPVVDAVAQLHGAGFVHRDIKPANLFLASRGLVLGDCGLAVRLDATERLTNTYENAGSRDWMPGWAMGMRLDDVKPSFDVFSCGKVLWAMVSGKDKLRLWYHARPEFSLSRMFPGNRDVVWVERILRKAVVEHEEDCLPDAAALLTEIDLAVGALQSGIQRPSLTQPMRCRFCGTGIYQPHTSPGGYQHHHAFRCPDCGHLALFDFKGPESPSAWRDGE